MADKSKTLRIDEILKAQNIKAVELAQTLKVSPQYVYNIINEKSNASVEMLKKFADALDVPLSSLFADSEPHKAEGQILCPHCGKPLVIEKAR